MAIGGDDLPPGQWDDELSSWPEDRRRVAAKRIAFTSVCGALITLIILTIVFVGKDSTSAARVTTNTIATSTTTTVGFATSLPVAATATSLGDTTTTSPTTTSTTLKGVVVLPVKTTTTTTTTTAPAPPFQYNPAGPKSANQEYFPNNPPCQPASSPGGITFNTPTPGHISIQRTAGPNAPATGSVSPSGDFDATVTSGGETDHYVGNTTQTGATGTLTITISAACPAPGATSTATWTFA